MDSCSGLCGGRLFRRSGFDRFRGHRLSCGLRLACLRLFDLLGLFTRREDGVEGCTFHARHEFDDPTIADVLDQPIDDLISQFAMGHLTAAEPQRRFNLVAFLQEADRLIFLCLVIMLVDGDRELDFLDDDDFLLFARRPLALVFLVEIFAVILNAANRRDSIGRDFYQIKTALPGNFQCFKRWEDPELLPIFVNDANLTRANPIVDANELFCRTFIDVPPPMRGNCARLVSIALQL